MQSRRGEAYHDRVHEQHTRVSVARAEVMKVAKKIVEAPGTAGLMEELNALVACERVETGTLAALLSEENQ